MLLKKFGNSAFATALRSRNNTISCVKKLTQTKVFKFEASIFSKMIILKKETSIFLIKMLFIQQGKTIILSTNLITNKCYIKVSVLYTLLKVLVFLSVVRALWSFYLYLAVKLYIRLGSVWMYSCLNILKKNVQMQGFLCQDA